MLDQSMSEDINPDTIISEISAHLNSVYSKLAKLTNYRYHLLIYRLLKNGHVKISHLAGDAGLSPQRLRKITEDFETFEKVRQNT